MTDSNQKRPHPPQAGEEARRDSSVCSPPAEEGHVIEIHLHYGTKWVQATEERRLRGRRLPPLA